MTILGHFGDNHYITDYCDILYRRHFYQQYDYNSTIYSTIQDKCKENIEMYNNEKTLKS